MATVGQAEWTGTASWDVNAAEWAVRLNRGADASREALLLPILVSILKDLGPAVVLDIGCGSGTFRRDHVTQVGARFLGVDASTEMCSQLRDSGHYDGVINGDAHSLPFPDSTVDAALASMVLQGVEDVGCVCAEVARVLRPGGHLIVVLLNPATVIPVSCEEGQLGKPNVGPVEAYARERTLLVRIRAGGDSVLPAPVQYFHRTLSSYMGAILSAGFHITGFYEPRADTVSLERNEKMRDFWSLLPFIILIARRINCHLEMDRQS